MKNNYGENFRVMRERLNLTQMEVASQMGISSASLSMRENEQRNFKVSELYQAHVCFGIDIGFGQVFDYMDSHENPEIAEEFSKSIQKMIKEKDYKNIALATLEELKEILVKKMETETNSNLLLNTKKDPDKKIGKNMTAEEKLRLKKILKKYQEKDGNIMRAIKLLEIAMQ